MKIRQSAWTIVLSATLLAGLSARAGFQYTSQDVVLGFRQAGGPYELVVDAGPVTAFNSLPAGTTITITNLNTGLLGASFFNDDGLNLNGLSFSASACYRQFVTTNFNTLWVTRPRDDINTQTTPWNRASQASQGTVAGQIDGIGMNAATYGNTQPSGTNNTTWAVRIPQGNTYDYSHQIGVAGNFSGTFQGNAEVTTSDTFMDDGQPVRADFYRLFPTTVSSSGASQYLGYFQLSPSGVLTYTAGAASVTLTAPVITGLAHTSTNLLISFNSINGAHYSLCFTNSTGLATSVTNWPVIGPIVGNGSVLTFTNSTQTSNQFFRVMVAP